MPLIGGLAQAQFQALAAEAHVAMARTFAPIATHLESLALRRPLERVGGEPGAFIVEARAAVDLVPVVTSLVAGNDRGEGWLYLSVPSEPPLVRITRRAEWGARHHFYWLNSDGSVLREEKRELAYDPRERQWYRLAKERPGVVVWTAPYRFFTTQELGVTGSVGWHDAQGQFWAVGLDTRLNEWQHEVTKLAIQLGGRIVLTDRDGFVLADSARDSTASRVAGEEGWLALSKAPWQQLRDKAGQV